MSSLLDGDQDPLSILSQWIGVHSDHPIPTRTELCALSLRTGIPTTNIENFIKKKAMERGLLHHIAPVSATPPSKMSFTTEAMQRLGSLFSPQPNTSSMVMASSSSQPSLPQVQYPMDRSSQPQPQQSRKGGTVWHFSSAPTWISQGKPKR
eukprot:TRINITY_DN82791_c0_g1_i1.p1 TRINITY_DN82791_c0_g1~~TRINITY_DN82791_c0_g1_i1.p1  ORF type:complete len:151 (-),score=36.72 TRINITY_DN82791_c0_g1_i1:138-590(-)